MLVAVATVVHRVFTYDKSLTTTAMTGIMIAGVMTAFSAWHCITDELTMHSVLFGRINPGIHWVKKTESADLMIQLS